jgi:hypothetical protein
MKIGDKIQYNNLIGYIVASPEGEKGYELIKVQFKIDERIKTCWIGSWHLTVIP